MIILLFQFIMLVLRKGEITLPNATVQENGGGLGEGIKNDDFCRRAKRPADVEAYTGGQLFGFWNAPQSNSRPVEYPGQVGPAGPHHG